jgi:hypothetical protein
MLALYSMVVLCTINTFAEKALKLLAILFSEQSDTQRCNTQAEQQKVDELQSTRTHKESEASMLASRAAATEEVCARLRQLGLVRDADAAASTLAALKIRAEGAHREAMIAEADADVASTAIHSALAAQGRATDEAQLAQTAVGLLMGAMEAEQSARMPHEELLEQERVAQEATMAAEVAAAEFRKLDEEIAAAAKQLELRVRGPERRAEAAALERELAANRKRVCSSLSFLLSPRGSIVVCDENQATPIQQCACARVTVIGSLTIRVACMLLLFVGLLVQAIK